MFQRKNRDPGAHCGTAGICEPLKIRSALIVLMLSKRLPEVVGAETDTRAADRPLGPSLIYRFYMRGVLIRSSRRCSFLMSPQTVVPAKHPLLSTRCAASASRRFGKVLINTLLDYTAVQNSG